MSAASPSKKRHLTEKQRAHVREIRRLRRLKRKAELEEFRRTIRGVFGLAA